MKEYFPFVDSHFSWLTQLITTLLLYSTVILPLLLLHTYFKKRYKLHITKGTTKSCCAKAIYICFVPDVNASENVDLPVPVTVSTTRSGSHSKLFKCINCIQSYFGLDCSPSLRTTKQYYTLLAFCFIGLQFSYLLWGLLQERIMTKVYDNEKFEKSQYLVFCNRLTALIILLPLHCFNLGLIVNPWQQGRKAPFIQYAYASVSNVISSWCQYEALMYISFPTQVILKACKVLPVMFMGKFIQRRVYKGSEYLTAGIICLGMIMFFYTDPEQDYQSRKEADTRFLLSLSGYILIFGYILCDSFTSNWQDYLFQNYKLTSLQVMAGVNVWSVLLTLLSLVGSGDLIYAVQFGFRHLEFNFDVLLSSLCSAFGQLFIFLTISQFGPASFVLIMTLRLGFSMILSCIIFSHALHPLAIVGIFVVFFGLFLRIYSRQKKTAPSKNNSIKNDLIVSVK
ncbi:unnamed protein product [Trichobilharzia szidati]|nr:unnamed protein product [Trichobilharzia szidati]